LFYKLQKRPEVKTMLNATEEVHSPTLTEEAPSKDVPTDAPLPAVEPEAVTEQEPKTGIEHDPEISESVPTDEQPLPLKALKSSHLPETPKLQAPKKLMGRIEEFLIPSLVLFLLGGALAFALPDLAFAQWPIGMPLLAILLGIVLYGINKPDSRWVIRLDAWVMVLIIGAMYYHYFHFEPGPTDISRLASGQQVELQGTVVNTLSANRLVMEVSKANWEKVSGQVILYTPKNRDSQPLEPGTRLLVSGELSLPPSTHIPGLFNYREYLRTQHITALLKHPSRMIAFEISNQPRFTIQRLTDQLKTTVSNTFKQALPSPQAEILGGIVLGDKAIPVDAATKQAFIQTGLIHVLAASGMNVGIIAMAVLWLMKRLKAPRHTQFIVAMLAVAFYSMLTGLPPSIQRAATMLELALFLKLLNRELSPLFLLCVASTLLVLVSPDNIGSVGFQFSVLTTFGLIVMVGPLQEALGYYITRWLAGLILVPLVAQLWIWPLSIAYFNQFPIHSVPLNIAALCLVTPLTILGFAAGLLSIVFAPIGAALSWLARPVLDLLLWVVQGGSHMSWAQWSLPSPQPWQIAGLYLALFTGLALMHRFKTWSVERKALLGIVPVALLLGGLFMENSQAQSQTRLEWLPLSETRQAVLVQPAQNQGYMLISPQRLRFYEARTLGDFLKHRHIDRLSALLLVPPPETEPSGTGSLPLAFRQTEIDLLVGSPDLSSPNRLNFSQQQAFPEQGARMALGDLHIEGVLNHLLIFSKQYCLLSLAQDSRNEQLTHDALPGTESCAVQASLDNPGRRITQSNGQASLEAEQYHQWVQDGPHLTLF
jgi:ComEC/Rec2-related protein